VEGLTKMYGNFLAVDRISFEVPKGTIVGFLGPNGAGKTTTIRMLTCYLPPTGGTAKVAGFDVFHESLQVRQNIGCLPESRPVGLDPSQIREARRLISELAGEHTVLLSTHILQEVEMVCQRVIIVARGRIVAQGTTDELKNRAGTGIRVEVRGPSDQVKSALN